jgi:ubiquinone/menaquinone biosynthesis C-methylase UbiE
MTPAQYDAWYETPRGRWIGETEFHLLRAGIKLPVGASVLDVGCGTGYFTRALARSGFAVTGLDPDASMIRYARGHTGLHERYLTGDARCLPFADACFDAAVAITSFCFIADPLRALSELARVARRRIVLGLLNRHSLLYRQKAGQGAYRGAHWHSANEVHHLFAQCGLPQATLRYAIFAPQGDAVARRLEFIMPGWLPLGGFLLAVADAG